MTFGRGLLVTLFLLLHILCFGAGYQAEILNHPKTQIAPVGSTVIFNCHMIGDGYWVFNGSFVRYADYDDFPGFDFEYDRVKWDPYEINLTISVVVSLDYNGTRIRCEGSAANAHQIAVSDTALLIAASPPTTPNLTVDDLNATTIQLTWPAPFTYDGFDIDHYTVTIEKRNTGEVHSFEVDGNEYVLYKTGGVAEECEEVICTVTASNIIGESNGMEISTGFPTVPGALSTLTSPEVTFKADLTPKVVITLQLPETCTYQTSWYTMVVEEESSNGVTVVYGPHLFTGRDPVTVEQDISDGLERDREYSVTVWVKSLAGRSPNTSANFDTILDVPTSVTVNNDGTSSTEQGTIESTTSAATEPTGTSVNNDGTSSTEKGTVESTAGTSAKSRKGIDMETNTTESTTHATNKHKDDSIMLIVTGASVGVVITLLLSVVIFVLVYLLRRRMHHGRKQGDGKQRPSMIPNPIYEPSTPIYESVEDTSWKPLIREAPSPTDSTDPRYFSSPPPLPVSPPPRKPMGKSELKYTEEKEAEKIRASFCDAHQGFPVGEESYTVMNPVGTLSRQNSQVPNPLPSNGDEYVTILSAQKK